MPTYQGRSYSLVGSPEEWLADDDGRPAPPEVVKALSKRAVRKLKRKLGHKPAGRHRQAQTAGERRRDMLAQGLSMEQVARIEGRDYEAIERSLRRAAARHSGQ
jgi:hypothetical protein